MCITAPVGAGGTNRLPDVKRVQLLLNMNAARIGLASLLVADGGCGLKTVTAIRAAQTAAGAMDTGTVAPDDATMTSLRKGLPPDLTRDKLWAIMVLALETQVDRYFAPLRHQTTTNAIATPLRLAHFLAQLGHESGDLRYAEEIADGNAYEGRADLGNNQKGDGPRFKGRGLIQLTGRANYAAYGQDRGRDFVTGDNPKLLASDPFLAADCAGWFWAKRGINALADADDLEKVTRRINGGLNGLADRRTHLVVATWLLM